MWGEDVLDDDTTGLGFLDTELDDAVGLEPDDMSSLLIDTPALHRLTHQPSSPLAFPPAASPHNTLVQLPDLSRAKLRLVNHNFHRREGGVGVVTNLRMHELELELLDARGQRFKTCPALRLFAELQMENGHPVPDQGHGAEPLLVGPTDVALAEGHACFRLKVTPLSYKMVPKQFFRLNITLHDPALRARYPELSFVSEAIKTVTKLPPPPRRRVKPQPTTKRIPAPPTLPIPTLPMPLSDVTTAMHLHRSVQQASASNSNAELQLSPQSAASGAPVEVLAQLETARQENAILRMQLKAHEQKQLFMAQDLERKKAECCDLQRRLQERSSSSSSVETHGQQQQEQPVGSKRSRLD